MKTLEKLVRAGGLELDNKRRALNQLWGLRDDIMNQIRKLDQDLITEAERVTASQDPAMLAAHGHYSTAVKTQQENLQCTIDELDNQIETAREELAEAFRQVKRYETVLDDRRAQHRMRQDRLQQARIDEIALGRRSQF